ncbi:MAG: glycosyltransferase family 4 protein [Fermentimonas sp.]|jgi:glycosyltransferase involved in cell wall biosynthesis
MRVLIISTYDTGGGAAIAASRLMHALQSAGHDVSMAVRTRRGNEPAVFTVGGRTGNQFRFYWERGVIYLHNRLSRRHLFDVSIANSGVSITDLPEFRSADVIHLHWINQGMLSLDEIGRIVASGKKVVWTMHDMWPFTGICHYASGCTRYEGSCGNCPYLAAGSPSDLSRKRFQKKQRVYAKGKITFVACSQWLRELAEKSPLTRGHEVVDIPNPIDTKVYFPMDKAMLRERMQLPRGKKIALFAAVKASDPRKGLEHLVQASHTLAQERSDLYFLIAGTDGEEIAERLPLPTRCVGYVPSERMPELYSAADLYITPSLQDNLPNTIMEAMACGTPCVGFHTGGIPEMIDHGVNGYVAKYRNGDDLARGVTEVLFESDWEAFSLQAREKVVRTYTPEKIANQYKILYDRE